MMLKARVIKGQGLGAKHLVPTLNLDQFSDVPNKFGVYACKVLIKGNAYRGVLHWGPKSNGLAGVNYLEVHVFDFSEDVYGEEIELEFCQFIREIKSFLDFDDLKAQIFLDIEMAKASFEKEN